MKIISDHNRDVRNPSKASGGYEWWYFDGWDEKNDLGFVIIFYDGNPFSTKYIEESAGKKIQPSEYPAISISIYRKGKPLYYSFTEAKPEEANFSSEKPDGKVMGHSFHSELKDNQLIYNIALNEELPSGDAISASITFESELNPTKAFQANNEAEHVWNLVQAQASVIGNISVNGKDHAFQGTGYHDHNYGDEPMDDSFMDWYWGRFHFEKYSLIYYIMNKIDGVDYKAWLMDENQQVIETFTDINYSSFSRNLFGLSSARKIELKSDTSKALIQLDHILDNGPFYQRFKSQIVLNYNDHVLTTSGVSEYIHPERIKMKVFWPLVKMRILQKDQPHWVQKSPTLYRWTW